MMIKCVDAHFVLVKQLWEKLAVLH